MSKFAHIGDFCLNEACPEFRMKRPAGEALV
jgi:hypothetical protein